MYASIQVARKALLRMFHISVVSDTRVERMSLTSLTVYRQLWPSRSTCKNTHRRKAFSVHIRWMPVKIFQTRQYASAVRLSAACPCYHSLNEFPRSYRSHLSRNSRRRKTAPVKVASSQDEGSTASTSSSRTKSVTRSPNLHPSSAAGVSPLSMPEVTAGTISPLYVGLPLPIVEHRVPPQTIDMRRPYAHLQPSMSPPSHITGMAYYAGPELSRAEQRYHETDLARNGFSPHAATPSRIVTHRHSYSALSNNITEPITPSSAYSGQSGDELESEGYFEMHHSAVTSQPPHSATGTDSLHSYSQPSSIANPALVPANEAGTITTDGRYLYGTLQQSSVQPSFAVPPLAQARHIQLQPGTPAMPYQTSQGGTQLYTYANYVTPHYTHCEPLDPLGVQAQRQPQLQLPQQTQSMHAAPQSVQYTNANFQLVVNPVGSTYVAPNASMHSAPITIGSYQGARSCSPDQSAIIGPSSAPAFTSTFFPADALQ